jgi:hypothetical protein
LGVIYIEFGESGPCRGIIEGGKVMTDKRAYVAVNMAVENDIGARWAAY